MKYFRIIIGHENRDYVIDLSDPEQIDDFIKEIEFLESQSIDYSCNLVKSFDDLCSAFDSVLISILKSVFEIEDINF